MYSAQVRVSFGDVDPAGIVYYPRFFHYFHCVYEAFLREHIFPLSELLRVWRLGLPVASLEVAFKRPLHQDDLCEVQLRLLQVKGTSLRYSYRIFTPAGQLSAEASVVTACVDLESHFPTLLPPLVRERFLAQLERG